MNCLHRGYRHVLLRMRVTCLRLTHTRIKLAWALLISTTLGALVWRTRHLDSAFAEVCVWRSDLPASCFLAWQLGNWQRGLCKTLDYLAPLWGSLWQEVGRKLCPLQLSSFLSLAARARISAGTEFELKNTRVILWVCEDIVGRDWHFLSFDGLPVHTGEEWVTFESLVPLHA